MHPTSEKIPVAISRCLVGDSVRYNGDHKHNRFCTGVLADYFEFVTTCPEMEIGLGVPRKPIRLVDHDGVIKVVNSDDPDLDYADALIQQGAGFAQHNQEICGFIATQNSPSCGAFGVKLYLPNGNPINKTAGRFTHALRQHNPLLPVEESGRLNDAGLRENFILRVYTYHRWLTLRKSGLTAKALVDFHSRHKYLLMSHSYEAYRCLGRLIANAGQDDIDDLAQRYINNLMQALSTPPQRGKHCNVLQHLMGYLKSHIDAQDKQELLKSIQDFRAGIVPLIVPIALLRHHLEREKEQHQYALNQFYLSPYPHQLGLRSHIH